MTGMLLATLLLISLALAGDALGSPRTMRLDYYHTGDATHETFSLDRVVLEPLAWPGNPSKAIDDTNLGKYLFEVIALNTGNAVYSRGFASIYGEWETTDEATKVTRTFSESLRFPEPQFPVLVIVRKRDRNNSFKQVWSTTIDPMDPFIDDAKPPSAGPLIAIQKTGDPQTKVDFLIIGDGYTAAERPKFEKDARRLTDILFTASPFKERRSDFNVWGLCPPAAESGISRPSTGVHRRSPLGATYDAFGSERYVLTFENRAFRDYASNAPYDFVEILVNGKTYGGGGIFGLYSTVAADSLWAPYVFVHEFGHHFAALADEYYTSPVAYTQPQERLEPWEPNVTALLDPSSLKWKDLVSQGTPVPTEWNKEAYEEYSRAIQKRRAEIRAARQPETVMDALFAEEKQHETAMFAAEKYAGRVGAFEGANYEARGYYRPQVDCIMFSRNDAGFCAVCRRAIERVIDLYSRK
jgi:hypothetical protein